MSCCSKTKFNLYIFERAPSKHCFPGIEIKTEILKLEEINNKQWEDIRKIQGKIAALYLKFRYGSDNTFILLGYNKGNLVYVQWIVPNRKLRKRYHFLKDDSFSIISCITSPEFRGNKIYPSQIHETLCSNRLPTNTFWIWASLSNLPSIHGIEKAGGGFVSTFIQRKFLWGLISFVDF